MSFPGSTNGSVLGGPEACPRSSVADRSVLAGFLRLFDLHPLRLCGQPLTRTDHLTVSGHVLPSGRAISLRSTASTDRHSTVRLRHMVIVELAACDGFAIWKHVPPIDRPAQEQRPFRVSQRGADRYHSILMFTLGLIPTPRATGREGASEKRRLSGTRVVKSASELNRWDWGQDHLRSWSRTCRHNHGMEARCDLAMSLEVRLPRPERLRREPRESAWRRSRRTSQFVRRNPSELHVPTPLVTSFRWSGMSQLVGIHV